MNFASTSRSSLDTLRNARSRNELPRVTSSARLLRRARLSTEAVLSTASASLLVSSNRKTPLVFWLAMKTSDAVLVAPTRTRRLPTSRSPKNSETSLESELVEVLATVAKIACCPACSGCGRTSSETMPRLSPPSPTRWYTRLRSCSSNSSKSGEAPSLNKCTSVLARLRVRFWASLTASSRWGDESVALAWPSIERSAALALVGDWRTSVTTPASSKTMRSLSCIDSMSLAASAFAWANLLGETSVACIDADTSRIATMKRLPSSLPAKYGRVSAKTANASRTSWITSNQLCRSFWNGELA